MNPVNRFKIDNYKEILREIEELGRLDYLRDLEDKVIKEIADLIHENSDEARAQLIKLEQLVEAKLDFTPRNKFLLSAFKNSLSGALSVAKFYLF
ncbi:hypothetical protein A3H38_05030 [candidate division WOR-1 bacterium RIFCSPLOWO2_02_FULL_46_20]|uniref:Uncharacterized protein n=2 Tax=Saganbacteria TaxID=1703751 RepID=A0A1F4R4F5_UNCSA|nr:MAG: hypothetical protein A3J44_03835 [candidate division WOR-1 bacterium RIFCSPHIGHO2_02_FULL_45_12]OGC03078.1 MAG: hypothetical protein A3H38_05030 [candidate division WOR-1 bacterium RIFCSPLOWO2_02_FULL_46_20]OGC08728.1 MAG: hypothetical protein A3F86_04310 [candidate division WOR-1 bacterium RIFCSPLOWO2_12_FULL_45_9]